MAFFGVTKEIIEEVKEHTNADRLEIGKLKGMDFRFVIPKGQFKSGDEVLYFPLDSLIPQNILRKIGLEGKLGGKELNRVSSIRLRGELSQGLVTDLSLIEGIGKENPTTEEITAFLGVEKYEAPVIECPTGTLVRLPTGQSAYDIEGADRYVEQFKRMLDLSVLITEKVNGCNWSITKNENNDIFVSQRTHSIQELPEVKNGFWEVARKYGFIDLVKKFPGKNIIIYGEILGPEIKKNYYGFADFIVKTYDVRFNYEFLTGEEFLDFTNKHLTEELVVPIIAKDVILKEWLNGKTVQEKSNGKSFLVNKVREGIVIRPYKKELRDEKIGRLILKQRSPDYLVKTDY